MRNSISQTAYYTLAARIWDADLPGPRCGDYFAKHFLTPEVEAVWSRFRQLKSPNESIVVRHRVIDDFLRLELMTHPDSLVVLVGAGFDTRPFRIPGGSWVEVDVPALIALKEARLPSASARQPLVRVPVEFSQEPLAAKLLPFATQRRALLVLEGVWMYLTSSQREKLLTDLGNVFPHHTLYCDLMRRSFFRKYSRAVHREVQRLGASFQDMTEDPESTFFKHGYQAREQVSVAVKTADFGGGPVPGWMVRRLLKTLREGYNVWKFEKETGDVAAE